ncbi:hypothetical protein QJQ45_008843 [Haematococcus lacustris]|nr:hypothetical protein QJQ45_008843 [Haematococcus lacustris]
MAKKGAKPSESPDPPPMQPDPGVHDEGQVSARSLLHRKNGHTSSAANLMVRCMCPDDHKQTDDETGNTIYTPMFSLEAWVFGHCGPDITAQLTEEEADRQCWTLPKMDMPGDPQHGKSIMDLCTSTASGFGGSLLAGLPVWIYWYSAQVVGYHEETGELSVVYHSDKSLAKILLPLTMTHWAEGGPKDVSSVVKMPRPQATPQRPDLKAALRMRTPGAAWASERGLQSAGRSPHRLTQEPGAPAEQSPEVPEAGAVAKQPAGTKQPAAAQPASKKGRQAQAEGALAKAGPAVSPNQTSGKAAGAAGEGVASGNSLCGPSSQCQAGGLAAHPSAPEGAQLQCNATVPLSGELEGMAQPSATAAAMESCPTETPGHHRQLSRTDSDLSAGAPAAAAVQPSKKPRTSSGNTSGGKGGPATYWDSFDDLDGGPVDKIATQPKQPAPLTKGGPSSMPQPQPPTSLPQLIKQQQPRNRISAVSRLATNRQDAVTTPQAEDTTEAAVEAASPTSFNASNELEMCPPALSTLDMHGRREGVAVAVAATPSTKESRLLSTPRRASCRASHWSKLERLSGVSIAALHDPVERLATQLLRHKAQVSHMTLEFGSLVLVPNSSSPFSPQEHLKANAQDKSARDDLASQGNIFSTAAATGVYVQEHAGEHMVDSFLDSNTAPTSQPSATSGATLLTPLSHAEFALVQSSSVGSIVADLTESTTWSCPGMRVALLGPTRHWHDQSVASLHGSDNGDPSPPGPIIGKTYAVGPWALQLCFVGRPADPAPATSDMGAGRLIVKLSLDLGLLAHSYQQARHDVDHSWHLRVNLRLSAVKPLVPAFLLAGLTRLQSDRSLVQASFSDAGLAVAFLPEVQLEALDSDDDEQLRVIAQRLEPVVQQQQQQEGGEEEGGDEEEEEGEEEGEGWGTVDHSSAAVEAGMQAAMHLERVQAEEGENDEDDIVTQSFEGCCHGGG